jgi:hypothetical protein
VAAVAARFAYDKSGSILACADGAEVLVYDGSDERPLWRAAAPSRVVAVATTPGEVLALDDGGRLSRFAAENGGALGAALDLGPGAARDLAVARDGTAVALVGDRADVVAHGARARSIAAPGGRAVALTDDGARVGILVDGALVIADVASGAERARVSLDGAASAVAWCVRGFFVVAAGARVLRVPVEGGEASTLVDAGGRVRQVAASADGGILALLGEDDVKIALLPSKELVGRFGYERPLEAVAFGPDVWLGVGLDRGDANRINLVSGACHRTDPHEGRARTTWTLSITLDTEKVRQARQTANPSAAAVQQKLAERQQQKKSAPPAPATAKQPEPAPAGGRGSSAPLFIALGVVALLAVAVALWLLLGS